MSVGSRRLREFQRRVAVSAALVAFASIGLLSCDSGGSSGPPDSSAVRSGAEFPLLVVPAANADVRVERQVATGYVLSFPGPGYDRFFLSVSPIAFGPSWSQLQGAVLANGGETVDIGGAEAVQEGCIAASHDSPKSGSGTNAIYWVENDAVVSLSGPSTSDCDLGGTQASMTRDLAGRVVPLPSGSTWYQ